MVKRGIYCALSEQSREVYGGVILGKDSPRCARGQRLTNGFSYKSGAHQQLSEVACYYLFVYLYRFLSAKTVF